MMVPVSTRNKRMEMTLFTSPPELFVGISIVNGGITVAGLIGLWFSLQEVKLDQKGLMDNQKGLMDNQKGLMDNQKGLMDSQKDLMDNQKGLMDNQGELKFRLDALFIGGALALGLFSGAGSIVQILQYFDSKAGVK
jgi:hypothetical protein